MFDAAYWRAKEGELARTIVANPHVRSARVHISQGVSGAFRRDVRPRHRCRWSQQGGVGPEQARALRFLVASAVPGLTPQDVSIIDGANGLVLGPDDAAQPAAQSADRARDRLRSNVERLLEAHVGRGAPWWR